MHEVVVIEWSLMVERRLSWRRRKKLDHFGCRQES